MVVAFVLPKKLNRRRYQKVPTLIEEHGTTPNPFFVRSAEISSSGGNNKNKKFKKKISNAPATTGGAGRATTSIY